MNEKKILSAIKKESLKVEWGLKKSNQTMFTYLINKHIRLQFYNLMLSIKMRFVKRK